MDFHKAIFLTAFLPVFLALYQLAARPYKNSLLLLASLIFYAWFEPVFVFVLIGTTLLDFFLVRLIAASSGNKRKLYLAISLCVNLSLLVWFKYRIWISGMLGFESTPEESKVIMLAIPLGISFYTFESITYLVDVYRGQQVPLKKFKDYLLYILLFPKLLGGPIIRYGEIADQINDRSQYESVEYRLSGFYRFCIGLAKKVLIADQLSRYYLMYAFGYLDPQELSAGDAWLALFAAFLMVYYDFSGYTDIALGIAKMVGFQLPENFHNPLLAKGITDFWQRWHITLSTWMKNYLYIPLGGNKKGTGRTYLNLLIVFIVSGIWHGAGLNYLLWGLFHGVLILAEKLIKIRIPDFVATVLTVLLVTYSMSLFFIADTDQLLPFQKALWGMNEEATSHTAQTEFWLPFIAGTFFAFFACTPFTRRIQERVFQGPSSPAGHVWLTIISVLLFILALSYSTSIHYTSFVYFRF
jgi:alginate O-acetyltransferase complex protein AlgI